MLAGVPLFPKFVTEGVATYDELRKRDTSPRMNEPRVNVPEWTVSELSSALKRNIEDNFGYVRVRGEISGYKGPHSSGHCYFALKDENARIEAVVWRANFARMR